jgi:aspartyl protease family protein
LSLHFAEEEAVPTFLSHQLFWMMHDKQGRIACLAMTLGRRTIIGAFQQVDTRFIYDVKESKLFFAPESCIQDTTKVDL